MAQFNSSLEWNAIPMKMNLFNCSIAYCSYIPCIKELTIYYWGFDRIDHLLEKWLGAIAQKRNCHGQDYLYDTNILIVSSQNWELDWEPELPENFCLPITALEIVYWLSIKWKVTQWDSAKVSELDSSLFDSTAIHLRV